MVNERFSVLLSPPNSPRMSDATAKTNNYYSQYAPHSTQYHPRSSIQHGPMSEDARHHTYDQGRHSLRSYKSSPYVLGGSSQLNYQGSHDLPSHPGAEGFHDRMVPHGPQQVRTTDSQPTTGAVSTPSSPTDRLTPRSESAHGKDQHDDDDVIDLGGEDQDEEGEKVPMTAAELRAAKRKMKRFRLTHNQTRFLMSEFARQAHPDAAHRERLAREIPGLSARQVQVWFQNRRAKLKRLTTDDRERMMRSRALPEHFDTTQALHSPFGAQAPPMSAPVGVGYPHYGESSGIRPLTLDTLRRVPDYEQYGQQYASISGVSPALGAFAFTPPQSASEHMSPASATSGMSPFVIQQQGAYEPSRRPPIGLPGASQPGYIPQQPAPRMPLHDRFARTLSEAAGSPLRTSLSYSALGSTSQPAPHYPSERASSFSEHPTYGQQRPYLQRHPSNSSVTEPSSYGLGFSYAHNPSYQQSEQQQQPSVAGSIQTSTDTEAYRRPGPPTSSYNQYETPSFNAPQIPQYQGYTAQYPSQNLPGGYQVTEQPRPQGQEQAQHQGQDTYPAVPGSQQPYMHQEVTDSQSPAHVMPMPPSY